MKKIKLKQYYSCTSASAFHSAGLILGAWKNLLVDLSLLVQASCWSCPCRRRLRAVISTLLSGGLTLTKGQDCEEIGN